eukprot:4274691-Prymnesium_polylepis.1
MKWKERARLSQRILAFSRRWPSASSRSITGRLSCMRMPPSALKPLPRCSRHSACLALRGRAGACASARRKSEPLFSPLALCFSSTITSLVGIAAVVHRVVAVGPRHCDLHARVGQHLAVHPTRPRGQVRFVVAVEVVAQLLLVGSKPAVLARVALVRHHALLFELRVAPVVDEALDGEHALQLALLLAGRPHADLAGAQDAIQRRGPPERNPLLPTFFATNFLVCLDRRACLPTLALRLLAGALGAARGLLGVGGGTGTLGALASPRPLRPATASASTAPSSVHKRLEAVAVQRVGWRL